MCLQGACSRASSIRPGRSAPIRRTGGGLHPALHRSAAQRHAHRDSPARGDARAWPRPRPARAPRLNDAWIRSNRAGKFTGSRTGASAGHAGITNGEARHDDIPIRLDRPRARHPGLHRSADGSRGAADLHAFAHRRPDGTRRCAGHAGLKSRRPGSRTRPFRSVRPDRCASASSGRRARAASCRS
jgi:hypothetical protein